jgi:hypothetical protein
MRGDNYRDSPHIQALYRLVALRGGLSNIGMHGLIINMILWCVKSAS